MKICWTLFTPSWIRLFSTLRPVVELKLLPPQQGEASSLISAEVELVLHRIGCGVAAVTGCVAVDECYPDRARSIVDRQELLPVGREVAIVESSIRM